MSAKLPPAARSDRFGRTWRWFCILGAIEAAAALGVLLALPREGPGFSGARIGILAFLFIAFVVLGIAAARVSAPSQMALGALVPGAALVTLASGVALYLLRYLNPAVLLPYFERLSIPLVYVLALGLQTLLLFSVRRIQLRSDAFHSALANLPRAAIAWLVLLAALLIVTLTKLGITPDPAYWGEPGVAILGWQLALALFSGLLILLVSLRLADRPQLDLGIAIGIWLLAAVVWLIVPIDVLKNSFYAPIGPPANAPFPNSDSGYYDSMAQSLLIGYPYLGEIPSRPLYVVFLAGLHWLLGQRYDLIIVAQTLVLALIPVILYFLGTAIHSRMAGMIAAIAAIAREWTSLVVSSATRVSNTKMLLVDLPTLLGMLLCAFMLLRWLSKRNAQAAVIAGGCFGLLPLLRTQTLALLPIVAVFGLLTLGRSRRTLYVQLALFFGAVVLTLAPWLIHNYLTTGQLTLDAAFQYRIIASQYRYTGNLDLQNVDLEGKSMLGALIAFGARDPAFVLGFIANHALATLVGSVLALPLFHDFPGLLAAVEPYWATWNGSLTGPNVALVIIYLGLIALGIASAWGRMHWLGLLPLALAVGYSITNGIARFSGWRYDLPADWVAYFYLAAGAAEMLLIGASLFGVARATRHQVGEKPTEAPTMPQFRQLIPVFAAFALVGSLAWLAANVASPRFREATPDALTTRLFDSASVRAAGITPQDIAGARASAGSVLEIGRALYPRFFSRGLGLASAHPWPAYAPRDFPRLGFLLLNERRQDVLLPSRDIPIGPKQAEDAIVLGCQRDGYIEARLVLIPQSDTLIQVAPLSAPCN